jgi:hypothetical protein
VYVRLYDSSESELDILETLVEEDAVDETQSALEGRLSNSTVRCHTAQLVDVAEDEPTYSPEDDRYVALMRQLTFSIIFSKVS